MFEAHNLSAEDFEQLFVPAPCWQKTYCRSHRHSLRPLRIWFAEGKRKDGEKVPHRTRFVYIEYQDNQGNNQFHCIEIPIAGQSVEQILAQAVNISIPALQG
ncbi:hypothetical protein [Motiliproteus sp. MSK22-1]|uniref:hypothetical protein n=1 Tax=Motiliproteus sp. MSK22-1 TaxID=1897630 RepID=UPI0009772F76|nr:hypothetical protein [Motiliproteus sp. MSK22-1]OMH31709.1 hypothetical protein BGP75_16430 [Motiliproteus sp. MSK22-1]